jgi:hypothetical protein
MDECITVEEPTEEWIAVEVREKARYGRVATPARAGTGVLQHPRVLHRSHIRNSHNLDFVRVYLQTTKAKKKTKKLSSCTGANAVPLSLGAGAGSKSAAMYQIKYMGKADDSGEADRTARHFAQRALNHAHCELEATQCAGIVLGQNSPGASHATETSAFLAMRRIGGQARRIE